MNTLELPPSWPDTAPTEILPGLWQGGTSESSHLGMPTKADHHRGERPFDLIVTLYADAQPAPWGVEEIRYGFQDAELDPSDFDRLREIATYAAARWQAGAEVLVRCQAGVNRSGLVVGLMLLLSGDDAATAISRVRSCRSTHVLCNESFADALIAVEAGLDGRSRRQQGLE
jgi:hypothetical protein